jgi:MFS family permease
MFGSLLLIAAGFSLRPLISELWHWYLFSAIVYAGFPGATIMPAGKLVGLWFPVTRGRVMGAVTAGNNFGGMTMTPIAGVLIATVSWQGTYVAFGITMAVLAIIVLLIVREDTAAVDAEMRRVGSFEGNVAARAAARAGITLQAALRTPQFWLVTVAFVCSTFTYQGVLTQLIQHFKESGLTPGVAGAGLSVIAGMGIGSKLAFGRASEAITARYAMVISIALQAVGVGLMILPGNAAVMWAGILVFGLGFGGLGALIVLVVQEAFGLREFGSIIGIIQVAQIASLAGGPELAGRVRDATGSFDLAFLIVIALFLTGIAALLLARPLKWDAAQESPDPAR